jgi:hypothetical protein
MGARHSGIQALWDAARLTSRLNASRRFTSRLSASRRFSFGSGRFRLEPAAGAARLIRTRGAADEGTRLVRRLLDEFAGGER